MAAEYGIVGKTVRNWLSRETGGKSSELLEMSRLRRENEALLELVVRLTLDSSLAEKKLVVSDNTKLTKQELAEQLGVSRSSLYYRRK